MQRIARVLETGLYVDDLDAAERFYGGVLGLELDGKRDGLFVFFKCGEGMLLLFEPGAASVGRSVPAHGAHGPGHLCFAVAEAALDDWKTRLSAAGVTIEVETEKASLEVPSTAEGRIEELRHRIGAGQNRHRTCHRLLCS